MKILAYVIAITLALVSPSLAQFYNGGEIGDLSPFAKLNDNTGGVASYSGPGDVVTGATAFYGLRGYNKAYATGVNHAINIRRASDSTTTDINILTNGNLDVATATSFCAATTCFVDTIYDQIGTHSLIQATTTAQPQLTFNCLGSLPCLTASSQLLSGAFITMAQPLTISFVAERTGTVAMSAVLGGDNTVQAGFNSVANQAFLFAGTTVTASATDSALHAIQAVANGATSTINVDGTLSGALSAGASSIATPLQLGASGVGTNLFNGLFAEGIVFGLGVSPANQTSLCHNQRLYWGSGGTC
jgi:Alpha-L-arabinofuranosidase B, catalytic